MDTSVSDDNWGATETSWSSVHNTKSQQNNKNCYVPTVHLFYGIVLAKHSRDITIIIMLWFSIVLYSSLFYHSTIILTLAENS